MEFYSQITATVLIPNGVPTTLSPDAEAVLLKRIRRSKERVLPVIVTSQATPRVDVRDPNGVLLGWVDDTSGRLRKFMHSATALATEYSEGTHFRAGGDLTCTATAGGVEARLTKIGPVPVRTGRLRMRLRAGRA